MNTQRRKTMKDIKPAILLFIIFTIICGGIYPALVTGIAHAVFPNQAKGSFITDKSGKVPADLVQASASGLDPHITTESARLQVPRVAKARGVSEDLLIRAVAQATEGRQLGFLGEPRVNVLELNLSLNSMR